MFWYWWQPFNRFYCSQSTCLSLSSPVSLNPRIQVQLFGRTLIVRPFANPRLRWVRVSTTTSLCLEVYTTVYEVAFPNVFLKDNSSSAPSKILNAWKFHQACLNQYGDAGRPNWSLCHPILLCAGISRPIFVQNHSANPCAHPDDARQAMFLGIEF